MFTNWLTTTTLPSTTQQASPPPDTLIEVGPPPFTRFTAHSSVLIGHSGYLRAILHREDGNNTSNLDIPIYIPNITSEQLEPLLTYMYTGYLELTIENIFGVLLATHILHMPRALEICRSFLLRTQTEGYMGTNILSNQHQIPQLIPNEINFCHANNKIIRPIPSKAMSDTNISFISAPSISTHHVLLPSRDTKFKKISKYNENEQRERSPIPSTSKINMENLKVKKDFKLKRCSNVENNINKSPQYTRINLTKLSSSNSPVPKSSSSSSSSSTSSYAPSQAENQNKIEILNDNSKIIVDVASCDGPVRFRRVLNDSYGRGTVNNLNEEKISRQYNNQHIVSFHQQMARNIIERNNISEESENSEDLNQNFNLKDSNEFYICVYCKHTFKSQYCYQKHAKRHLNPLVVENEIISDGNEEKNEKIESTIINQPTEAIQQPSTSVEIISSSNKREVRPLDMNVQYYPCKTCGCKFPSYYFVHKHRKMCHADEEN